MFKAKKIISFLLILASFDQTQGTFAMDRDEDTSSSSSSSKKLALSKDTENTADSKNVVLIVNPSDDHNGVFKGGDPFLAMSFEVAGYAVREIEASSSAHLIEQIKPIPDHSIAHVIIRGHGNPQRLVLGQDPKGSIDLETNATEFFQFLSKKIAFKTTLLQPTLLLHSCSTGKKTHEFPRPLGEFASMHLPDVKVFAPDTDIATNTLEIKQISNQTVEYSTDRLVVFEDSYRFSTKIPDRSINPDISQLRLNDTSDSLVSELQEIDPIFKDLLMIARNAGQNRKDIQRLITSLLQSYHKKLKPLLEKDSSQETQTEIDQIVQQCKNLVNDSLGCGNGIMTRLQNELMRLSHLIDIEGQIIAKNLELKDQIIIELSLDQTFLDKLIQNSQESSAARESMSIKFIPDGNQIHFSNAIKMRFKDDLGFTPPDQINVEIELKIIRFLFSNENQTKDFIHEFLNRYQKAAFVSIETLMNDFLLKPDMIGRLIEVIEDNKNAKDNFCKTNAHDLFYSTETNASGQNWSVTRKGIYCFLLASGLIEPLKSETLSHSTSVSDFQYKNSIKADLKNYRDIENLITLIKSNPDIEEVDLNFINFSESEESYSSLFNHLKEIKSLKLSGFFMKNQDIFLINSIKNLTDLRSLSLNGLIKKEGSSELFLALKQLKQLQSLALASLNLQIYDRKLIEEAFKNLTQLQSIEIRNFSNQTINPIYLSHHLKRLQHIAIKNTSFTDKHSIDVLIETLVQLPDLHSLDLCDSSFYLESNFFESLHRLKRIRHLHLSKISLFDNKMAVIFSNMLLNMPHLTSLSLSSIGFYEEGFKILSHTLGKLILLEKLSFSRNAFPGSAMIHLAPSLKNLSRLQSLSFSNSRLGDEVPLLALTVSELPSLQKLQIERNCINSRTFDEVSSILKKTKIEVSLKN